MLIGIATRHIHKIFHKVIDKWFLDYCLVKINGVGYSLDDKKRKWLLKDFATKAMEFLPVVLRRSMGGL